MADYIPGHAATYRSSFSPTPPPRRLPLQHSRSQTDLAPKTSSLTPISSSEASSPQRSQSQRSTYIPSHTPAVSSPLARTSTLTGNESENDLEVNMPMHNPFKTLKEKSSRIFRRNTNPTSSQAQGLTIAAPSQVVVPERYRHLLQNQAPPVPALYQQSAPNLPGLLSPPQQQLRPQLSMVQVAERASTGMSDNTTGSSSARTISTTTKTFLRREGFRAQEKRRATVLQKKRRPSTLSDPAQSPVRISSPSSMYSREIDDGEPDPSTQRVSRAPQLPDLDFAQEPPAEEVPAELEGSPEHVHQGETEVEQAFGSETEQGEESEPAKFRTDIHATSGEDFCTTMSACKQRVLSGGGTLVDDTTYLSGFLYEWPAHRENVLVNGEATAQGGHIDVLRFVVPVAALHPLRMHPYTAPLLSSGEKVRKVVGERMARSRRKLREFYGVEVERGSESLGKGLEVSLEGSDGEGSEGEWEDLE